MTAADIHLLHGDPARAAQGYVRVLAAAPGLPSAWVGLGLAAEHLGEPSAARALLRHPEAVRALHGNLAETTRRAPDPLALADWVGRVPRRPETTDAGGAHGTARIRHARPRRRYSGIGSMSQFAGTRSPAAIVPGWSSPRIRM
ncbi:hypothetical protein ACU686_14510 [Yinghuangia aomiensis]